ncbi:hypothetical protein [Vibrio atlanticus]|uniref:hypothetical protein n=1 Tax=Vibrio atlanticus TaxID=693153 RepID=UPI003551F82B
MTTFLIDSSSGACDSLWTNQQGLEVAKPLDKYLFISDLDVFDEDQQAIIQTEKVIFYAGCYEQILLQQALSLGLINDDTYAKAAAYAKDQGYGALAYAIVTTSNWTITHRGCNNDQGLVYGGTGGNHARLSYANSYQTKAAVEEACKLDPLSGPPVSHYHYTLNGEDYFEDMEDIGNDAVDNIYSLTENLINSIKAHREGGTMNEHKNAGYSTASSPEAPPVDISQVIENHHAYKGHDKKKKTKYANHIKLHNDKIKKHKQLSL